MKNKLQTLLLQYIACVGVLLFESVFSLSVFSLSLSPAYSATHKHAGMHVHEHEWKHT